MTDPKTQARAQMLAKQTYFPQQIARKTSTAKKTNNKKALKVRGN